MEIFRSKNFNRDCCTTHIVLALFACIFVSAVSGQGCPYNIDFEAGTFDRWTCLEGTVFSSGSANVMSLSRATLLPNSSTFIMYTTNTGEGYDRYGNFPVNCPNGSGHSILLGGENTIPIDGVTNKEISLFGLATAVSYDFTIPANQNEFTLTYNYADGIIFKRSGTSSLIR